MYVFKGALGLNSKNKRNHILLYVFLSLSHSRKAAILISFDGYTTGGTKGISYFQTRHLVEMLGTA